MSQTPRAIAKDHASSIGAALSVIFMSLSIACTLVLINLTSPAQPDLLWRSAPAQFEASVATAPPIGGPQAPDASPSGAPQPGGGSLEATPPTLGLASVSPPEVIAGPQRLIPPAARPVSPPVSRLSVQSAPARTTAIRPARREVSGEPTIVAPVQPRARIQAPLVSPRVAQKPEPAVAGMITPSMLHHLSVTLNLTSEQRALYVPLERALLSISAQQTAMVRAGQDPKDAFSVGTVMSMYGVAQPFLGSLREDQKARVRAEARNMGYGFAAAQI